MQPNPQPSPRRYARDGSDFRRVAAAALPALPAILDAAGVQWRHDGDELLMHPVATW